MTAIVDEERLEVEPGADCAPPRIKPRATSEITKRMRTSRTIWCPGCSNGTIARGSGSKEPGLPGLPSVALG